jgi:hypothetical protein
MAGVAEVDVFPNDLNVDSYSVTEDAISLVPGDLSAGTGAVTVTGDSFEDDVFLWGTPMTLSDARRGSVTGLVSAITDAATGVSLSGYTEVNKFNVNRSVPPQVPTVQYNYAANPSFETATGTFELCRNYAPNPKPTSAAPWTTDYSFGGTGAGTTSYNTGSGGTHHPTEYVRMTWTTASDAASGEGIFTTTASLSIGNYTASVFVRTSLAQRMVVGVSGATATVTSVSSIPLPTVGGAWTRLIVSFTVTVAGTVTIKPKRSDIALAPNHAWAVGETLDVSGLMVSAGTVYPRYMDGTTTWAGATPSWTGTANNSASILTATGYAPTVGTGVDTVANSNTCVRSNAWSAQGTYSALSAITPGLLHTHAPLYTAGTTPAGTYTVQIRKRIATTLVAVSGPKIRVTYTTPAGTVVVVSPDYSKSAGEDTVSFSFALPLGVTSLVIRAETGSVSAGGWLDPQSSANEVFWDQLLITNDVYSGAYFDGSTAPVSPYTFAWAGTANQSQSTKTGSMTFGQAFSAWCALVGISSTEMISDIANRVVGSYPGWNGNVWEMIKNALTAEQLELYTEGTTVGVREIRSTTTSIQNVSDLQESVGDNTAAKYVDVAYYNNTYVSTKEIYPIPGEEPTIYQVGAGETIEFDLTLNTYLSAVNQPVCVDWVEADANYYDGTAGVYSIAGNDNLPYLAEQWIDGGGSVEVSLTDDPSVLHVVITGARDGTYAPYRIAMSSGNFYNSLRITGTGTQTLRQTVRIASGADPNLALDDAADEIDNPFISTLSQAINIGARAAAEYTGVSQSLTGDAGLYDLDFGTAPGARILQSGANFRVSNVTYLPDGVNITATADTTLEDLENVWEPSDTLGMLETEWSGRTLKEWMLRPLRRVNV